MAPDEPTETQRDFDYEAELASLVPKAFDSHTFIVLRLADNQPPFTEPELERLQIAHLRFIRGLMDEGLIIANGPLRDQTDPRLRGISIYTVPLADALERARQDPMVTAGRFAIEGARWTLAAGDARFGHADVDSEDERSSIE